MANFLSRPPYPPEDPDTLEHQRKDVDHLGLSESVQRILVRRALEGHHPQSQDDLIAWLDTHVLLW